MYHLPFLIKLLIDYSVELWIFLITYPITICTSLQIAEMLMILQILLSTTLAG